jgi:hypothetical protein
MNLSGLLGKVFFLDKSKEKALGISPFCPCSGFYCLKLDACEAKMTAILYPLGETEE